MTDDVQEQAAAGMGLDVEDAPGWRPEPGDLLVGEVVKIARAWSDYKDGWYPILTILPEGEDDPVSIHAFHYVLADRILEIRPQVGETIGVRYKGKVDSRDGKRQISVYNVRVKGRDVQDPYAEMTSPRAGQVVTQAREPMPVSATDNDDIPF